MNKKMVGGIIVLVALVGFVGVFLLIGRNTDTEPIKVYKAKHLRKKFWRK